MPPLEDPTPPFFPGGPGDFFLYARRHKAIKTRTQEPYENQGRNHFHVSVASSLQAALDLAAQ
jgi:hypothetical protein